MLYVLLGNFDCFGCFFSTSVIKHVAISFITPFAYVGQMTSPIARNAADYLLAEVKIFYYILI